MKIRYGYLGMLAVFAVGCGNAVEPSVLVVTLQGLPADVATAKLQFAYQDGDGPWQMAPAPVGATISISLADSKYGFAIGCALSSPRLYSGTVEIIYSTVAESLQLNRKIPSFCPRSTPTGTMLEGSLVSTPGKKLQVAFGRQSFESGITTALTTPYSIATLPQTADLLAVRLDADGTVDRFQVERSISVGQTSLSKNLDFDSMPPAEGTPQPLPAGVTNSFLQTSYVTTTSRINVVDTTPPFTIFTPSPAQRKPSDAIEQFLEVSAPEGSIFAEKVVEQPSAFTIGPQLLTSVAATRVNGTKAFTIEWSAVSNATYYASFDAGATEFAEFSPGWLDGKTTWTTADLSTIAGWNPLLVPDPAKPFASLRAGAQFITGSYPAIGSSLLQYSKSVDVASLTAK
jgi:hypothetical protein